MYRKIALITVGLALSTACTSQITGNEGNFQFSYPADDRPLDFNKPVAVGAFLDMQVRDVGEREPVEVQSASFDDPAILAVDDFSSNDLTIEGVGDGNALLTVEGTTASDETLTDSVNMLARVPEVHELEHTCDEGATTATYLTDQRVWVPYEFEMSNGQPVIGWGYYPVAADPASAMTIAPSASGQQFMAFDVGTTAGLVTLTSDIDGTSLEFDVVEPSAIDGVAEPTAFVLEDIDVGDTNPFYVLPQVGDSTVCQADTPIEVTSDSPGICAVSTIEQPDVASTGDTAYQYGWFEIEGLAEGECTYTVTYTEGSDGAGTSTQFTYPIEP